MTIYLDHAASTPLDPRVLEAMLPWLRDYTGNPASDHAPGRLARAAVEQARSQVAVLLGAQAEEIVWTSGATESNNLAIKGAIEFQGRKDAHVVSARTEHRSVVDACRHLETRGVRVTYLTPGPGGWVDPDTVLAALTPQTVLVSLMWVNNETGAINPVERLAPLLRERGVLFHVDGVQAAGKLSIDLATTPIDLLSLSAHKLYGPKGIGALFVRKRPRARLAPQLHGGGHEQGMRSGTLATHQIAGMGEACTIAGAERDADMARIGALRDSLWQALGVLPGIHRNGDPAVCAAHILNVSFEGVEGESLRALLPGLALSSGSACSSASREPSYVLRALGRDDDLAGASLRFSLGRWTRAQEIQAAAEQVLLAVHRLRALSPHNQSAGRLEPLDLDGEPDVFGYPEPVWRLLAAPRAGRFPTQEPGLLTAHSGSRSSKAALELQVRLEEGRITDARFLAHGCPTTIAVGAWLAQRLIGAVPADLSRLRSADIRAALEIPEDRAHCALMGEDLVVALAKQVPTP